MPSRFRVLRPNQVFSHVELYMLSTTFHALSNGTYLKRVQGLVRRFYFPAILLFWSRGIMGLTNPKVICAIR